MNTLKTYFIDNFNSCHFSKYFDIWVFSLDFWKVFNVNKQTATELSQAKSLSFQIAIEQIGLSTEGWLKYLRRHVISCLHLSCVIASTQINFIAYKKEQKSFNLFPRFIGWQK